MLKELFTEIRESAIKDAQPKPSRLDLPNGVTRVYSPDGKSEDLIALPDRAHILKSVDQVGPFVAYHVKDRDADPVVWFNDEGVCVVLDDGIESRRKNTAELTFAPTDEFAFVCKMAKSDPDFVGAKVMIKLLRRELWDAFEDQDARDRLIKLLRTVRFEDDEQAKLGTVKRTMSSLADETGFPEKVVLSLRPFDDPAMLTRFDVRCHFEVDPDTKSFALIPIKSELKSAQDRALAALQELLVANVTCPIFRGAP